MFCSVDIVSVRVCGCWINGRGARDRRYLLIDVYAVLNNLILISDARSALILYYENETTSTYVFLEFVSRGLFCFYVLNSS